MSNRALWAVAVSTLVVAAPRPLLGQNQPSPTSPLPVQDAPGVKGPGRADNGRELFRKVGCYQCHGNFAHDLADIYAFLLSLGPPSALESVPPLTLSPSGDRQPKNR
jgi:hypothetical protein